MCCGDRVCPAPPDLPSRLRGSSETAEKGVDNCCNRRRRFLQVQMVPALEAMGLDMLETVDPLQQQLAPSHHPLAASTRHEGGAVAFADATTPPARLVLASAP